MEHLNKQQIVLLTLLVSFVTSLSTGIVTVSLMDQAPASVTRTINQVIEKTIQQSAPQDASVGTISISVNDQTASATAAISSSTVKIINVNTNAVIGLGIIITKTGSIFTDKNNIDSNQSYAIMMADGTIVPVLISSLNSNILMPKVNYLNGSPLFFKPAQIASTYSLGQKVFSLTGTSSFALHDGLITQISSTTVNTSIYSSTNTLENTAGSPLFDIQGNIIGLQNLSINSKGNTVFNLVAPLIPPTSVL